MPAVETNQIETEWAEWTAERFPGLVAAARERFTSPYDRISIDAEQCTVEVGSDYQIGPLRSAAGQWGWIVEAYRESTPATWHEPADGEWHDIGDPTDDPEQACGIIAQDQEDRRP